MSTTNVPEVEIMIRVHDQSRPLRRAIDSVLSYPKAGVVVLAHGIDPSELDIPENPRVRVVSEPTGIGFPGVASNAGFRAVWADFVGMLDSDDYFEPGAVEWMHTRAITDAADVVLAPLRIAGKAEVLPLTWRTKDLEPVRDRLFYRTAPLGLIRREIIQDPSLKFDETLRTGEDMRVTAKLWTSDLRISYHFGDPCYVVTDDAEVRVTSQHDQVTEAVRPIEELLSDSEVQALPAAARRALATKILRVHVLAPVTASASRYAQKDFEVLSDITTALLRFSPDALDSLSAMDAQVLSALAQGDRDQVKEALRAHRSALRTPWRVFPSKPWRAFTREANLRRVAEERIVRLRNRKRS